MHKNKNNEKLFEHYCLKFLVIFLFRAWDYPKNCEHKITFCVHKGMKFVNTNSKTVFTNEVVFTNLNLAIQIHLFSKKECRGTPASVKFWCVVTKLLQSYYIRQNVITL